MRNYFLLSLSLLFFSLMFHLLLPSYFHNHKWAWENTQPYEHFLKNHISDHKKYSVFSKRIVFTKSSEVLENLFNLKATEVYFPLQFFFLFLGSFGLIYFCLALKVPPIGISLSVIFYYLTFSNLFHHFVPMYTYDELSQYFFILIALALLYTDQKLWVSFLFICISLLARESIFILFPALSFFLMLEHGFKNKTFWLRWVSLLVVPTILYYGYLKLMNISDINDRFTHYERNLQSSKVLFTSLFGFVEMTFLPYLLIFINFKMNLVESLKEKRWLYAFIGSSLLNFIIVILTTQAWETRLYVIPLYLYWPFAGLHLYRVFKVFNGKKLVITNLEFISSLLLGIVFFFAYYHHDSTFRKGMSFYFSLYIIICFVIFTLHKKTRQGRV